MVRELERRGGDILALIVSGCPAPHLRATRTDPGPRTDSELVDRLRSWGGTPVELLDDPEFVELALRPLRADLALCDRYRSRPGAVRAPLTALAGTDDVVATVPEVEAWAAYSARWRGVHVVAGGHFFVHAPGGRSSRPSPPRFSPAEQLVGRLGADRQLAAQHGQRRDVPRPDVKVAQVHRAVRRRPRRSRPQRRADPAAR